MALIGVDDALADGGFASRDFRFAALLDADLMWVGERIGGLAVEPH